MKLSALTRDERTITEGVWIAPVPGETGELLVRGITPRFRMRQRTAVRKLVREHKELDAAPAGERLALLAPILFEELVLDVRGFTHADGRPATRADLLALASSAVGEPAYDFAVAAVDMATARRESDAEEAVGNSSAGPGAPMAPTGSTPSSPATPPTP